MHRWVSREQQQKDRWGRSCEGDGATGPDDEVRSKVAPMSTRHHTAGRTCDCLSVSHSSREAGLYLSCLQVRVFSGSYDWALA